MHPMFYFVHTTFEKVASISTTGRHLDGRLISNQILNISIGEPAEGLA